ncbi:MAG: hypothetical protein ACMUJM_04770 [bacterium]
MENYKNKKTISGGRNNMYEKYSNFFLVMIVMMACCLLFCGIAHAQYWTAMPPYNILWPLWSPALSPIDLVTGYTTPLVTSLTRDTVLPVQPALVWDPSYIVGSDPGLIPYLLYNTPPAVGSGLLYYHDAYGLNPWPPDYMLDAVTGEPAPIPLPLGWSLLSPYNLGEFEYYVPIANIFYALTFGITGQGYLDLLQSWDIWGPTTRTGIPLTPIILP